MKRKLLKSMLLAVAMLCVGVGNVWADETIGNVDQGWGENNKEYTLAPGKSLTINFTVNSTKNTENYQGWITQVLNGSNMIFFMQPSCGYAVGNWDWSAGGATYNGNSYNWDGTNFRENLQGASVNYCIKRVGNNIVLTEHVTTTSTAPNASAKMGHHFVFPYTSDADLKVVFGADAAELTIADATISDTESLPTVYGTLVGNELNGTAWWTAFSDYYSIAANETKTVYFKNYSSKIANWHNWVLYLTSDADRGSNTEYLALRTDNAGWGGKFASGTLTSNYNWNTFRDELDGATVKMTVARSEGTVTVTANQLAATDLSTIRTETFTFTDNDLASDPMRFFLTTEGGHLDILDNDYAITVSSNNNSYGTAAKSIAFSDAKAIEGTPVTVTATPNSGYRFVNWTEGGVEVSTNATYTYTASSDRTLVANFEEIPSYTYSVIDNLGNTLASGSAYEGTNVYFYVPYYAFEDGRFYASPSLSSGSLSYGQGTISSIAANTEITVTYTEETNTNVVFFSEAENLASISEVNDSYTNIRMSNGKAGYYGAQTAFVNLPAGTYTLTAATRSGSTTFYARTVGEGTELMTISSSGAVNTMTSDPFTLTGNTDIYTSVGSSSKYFDYVIIRQTAVTGTIPTSGFGSLASAYGLDFSSATVSEGELTAYVVNEITADKVKLTSVDEMPANSGVILEGTHSATYSIPVKADATFEGTNKLKAAVTATAIDANEAYILQSGAFHLVTNASTVPAGKAYLLASDVPASVKALSFDFGDAVAISDVSSKMEDGQSEIFNLAGQRMSKVQKGVNIVNGKKVLVK